MRLGIFGGTFDPIHFAHLLLAEQCREQCELDEVWFVPSGRPPHKESDAINSGQARCDMIEMAIAGQPRFKLSKIELQRTGTTYTVDTLQQIQSDAPDAELFFLIGGDSLQDFPNWREPQRITELATVVAVNRRGCQFPGAQELEKMLGEDIAARVRLVVMPDTDYSATDIRQRIARGQSVRYMLPRAVEAYIAEHQLYSESIDA